MECYRITAQVLNGATGEVREVVARVRSTNEQDAVNALFNRGRRDDYYYRFLSNHGVLIPTCDASLVKHNGMEYWAKV